MPLAFLLAIPLAGAAAVFFARRRFVLELVYGTGAGAALLSSVFLAAQVLSGGPVSFFNGFLYADALSALVTLLTCLVWALSAPYTVGYLRGPQPSAGESPAQLGIRDLRLYYTLSLLFVFTLLAVSLTGNLGLMWVALEGATLASVFLVAFYGKPTSLEAAWKYAIIGGVGLSMALFGTILTYYAAHEATGMETWEALNWPFLLAASPQFNPLVMRLAFILVLLGYGAKAGLAPMHTWKPDAYSEAPVPAAAMMATAMLNCALYGLGRFFLLSARATGAAMPSQLLVLFGILSIAVAMPFILVQRSFRRLLAYSSIDHCGIIALSLGFGGPLGSLGAVLHMSFHALAKPLLFFCAGNAQQHAGDDSLRNTAGGLIRVLPMSGAALFAAVLAVTGTPPFPLFLSEFTVLRAGFAQGYGWVSIIAVALFVLIFSGMFAHVSRLLLGPAPDLPAGDRNRWTVYPLLPLAALLLLFSFWMPAPLSSLLAQSAALLEVKP
jgi:hydrogenase-4 component F